MLKKEHKYCKTEFAIVGAFRCPSWSLRLQYPNSSRLLSRYDVEYRLACVSKPWITKAEIKQRQSIEKEQKVKLLEDFFHFIGPSYPKDGGFENVLGDLEYLHFDDAEWDEPEEKEEFRRNYPELFEARKKHPEEISQFFEKFQDAHNKSLETRRYNGNWKPKEEWDELKEIYETALQDFKTLPSPHDSQGIEEVTQQGQ